MKSGSFAIACPTFAFPSHLGLFAAKKKAAAAHAATAVFAWHEFSN
ncbi:hypothetical protein X759_06035 [Mesorhizobium sp. LSHC420B00]|nr:hypothetical protein X759_06035 [Mesorhizobium sp. LSHC420B00]